MMSEQDQNGIIIVLYGSYWGINERLSGRF